MSGVEIYHQASEAKDMPIWNTRQNLFSKFGFIGFSRFYLFLMLMWYFLFLFLGWIFVSQIHTRRKTEQKFLGSFLVIEVLRFFFCKEEKYWERLIVPYTKAFIPHENRTFSQEFGPLKKKKEEKKAWALSLFWLNTATDFPVWN